VHQVLVDGESAFKEAVEFVGRIDPTLVPKIRRYEGREALFGERGVEQQLERALRPRVWLKSGGFIVIQSTEALVAVDVNTGKYVGSRRLEETVLKTNLEAVAEIVRQIRLRDLGGIIVIDFIDMEEQTRKDDVLQALRSEMNRDRWWSRACTPIWPGSSGRIHRGSWEKRGSRSRGGWNSPPTPRCDTGSSA